MNVYIVGRGAVGTYLGDVLRSVNIDVTYAPRDIAQVQPIDADVAIVATKAYDTPGAIATLRQAIAHPAKCVFMTPQNGVGNEELLAEAFGADQVLAAALTVPVEVSGNGQVNAANDGGLGLSPVGNSAFNWLNAAFTSAGVNVKVLPDWRAMKWSKLALNVIANASCAILNVLPGRLVHFERIFTLEIRMLREVRAVMQAMKLIPIDLPRYPVRALFAIAKLPTPVSRTLLAGRVANARGTKPPSLLLDLRKGNPETEIGALNGAVVRAGLEYGVPTPVNAVYARVLNDIANMPALWPKYRERPEALEQEVLSEMRRVRALTRG